MIYAIFCCFLLILLSLCLHSLLHASIETGCSLKNNSLASKHFGNSWFRYLYDCQILLKVNLIKTDHLLSILNQINDDIQFTMEKS